MKAQAIEVYKAEGAEAVVAYLRELKTELTPAEHVQLFSDVMRYAYWDEKNLTAAIQLGQAGIAFGEQMVQKHPDQVEAIQSSVKGMYYDIASFTWPGWDEAGITIDDGQIQLGLAAAKDNLRLAQELRKDPLPCSRAHWLLAVQEMAARQYEQAKRNFQQAEMLARQAEAEGEALLADGFVAVVGLLENPDDERLKAKLEDVRKTLRPMDHGKFFIAQLFDSLRIFQSLSIE